MTDPLEVSLDLSEMQEEINIHIGSCRKNPLNKFEWQGCPYVSEDRRPDDTQQLYSCKLCGLEIIHTFMGNYHWRAYLSGILIELPRVNNG